MDKKELGLLEDLKIMTESSGGKYLIEMSKKATMYNIENIANSYQMLNHEELVTKCARLKANLDMYQLLTGVEDQIKAIDELLKAEQA
jgi:hypothetical protein